MDEPIPRGPQRPAPTDIQMLQAATIAVLHTETCDRDCAGTPMATLIVESDKGIATHHVAGSTEIWGQVVGDLIIGMRLKADDIYPLVLAAAERIAARDREVMRP